MPPIRSSTRLAVPAFPDSYGPRYIHERSRSIISIEMERAEPLGGNRLGELYVRHAADGIRLAYLLTGDRALAEDLVQEAFARFVGRLLHLRHPAQRASSG